MSGFGGTFEIKSEKGRRKMEDIFLRAVYQSHRKVVADCLAKGVNPNLLDEDDLAALHTVAIKGDLKIGKELLNNRQIMLNIRCQNGDTPLMLACQYEKKSFVKALLSKGANPNLVNDRGQTALHLACITSHIGNVTQLTGAKANVNVVDAFDCTPLTIAVSDHPSESIVRHLLRKGAIATGIKEFPLLLECVLNCNSKKRLEILKILIQYSEDINCSHPISNRNCLHYVGITGYRPAAEFLLLNGANVFQVDKSNRTPLQIAQDHQNRDIIRLFRLWINKRKVYFFDEDDPLEDVQRLFNYVFS